MATPLNLKDFRLDFIENDALKTTMVTLKTVNIMDEIQEMSWGAIVQTHLPTMVVLAENDHIVDNNKVLQFLGHRFADKNRNKLVKFGGSHAIHFEKPVELAEEILRFIHETIEGD